MAALLLAVGLALIPFRFGSGRWRLEWMTTTYDVGLMMFVVFVPWFVVSLGLGAAGALTPVVMLLFAAAYGAGRWSAWRRVRAGRAGRTS